MDWGSFLYTLWQKDLFLLRHLPFSPTPALLLLSLTHCTKERAILLTAFCFLFVDAPSFDINSISRSAILSSLTLEDISSSILRFSDRCSLLLSSFKRTCSLFSLILFSFDLIFRLKRSLAARNAFFTSSETYFILSIPFLTVSGSIPTETISFSVKFPAYRTLAHSLSHSVSSVCKMSWKTSFVNVILRSCCSESISFILHDKLVKNFPLQNQEFYSQCNGQALNTNWSEQREH